MPTKLFRSLLIILLISSFGCSPSGISRDEKCFVMERPYYSKNISQMSEREKDVSNKFCKVCKRNTNKTQEFCSNYAKA